MRPEGGADRLERPGTAQAGRDIHRQPAAEKQTLKLVLLGRCLPISNRNPAC
jgi:hypothetical protein